METTAISIKKLNNFKQKYYDKMTNKWLIDLLIALQEKSVNTLNKYLKMGYSKQDMYNLIANYAKSKKDLTK